MPLVLAPSFDDRSRAEIEAHLEAVRARRLAAAIEYHQGKSMKLTYESDKIQKRMAKQYELLAKEMEQLDKIDEKIQDRLAGLIHLQNELGLTHDMIELHQVPSETEEE